MISIKKYNKKLIGQWNDFVSLSNNGTLFSNRVFLNYHINRSFKDCSLLFYHNQKIVAVLPAAIQNNSLCSPILSTLLSLIIAICILLPIWELLTGRSKVRGVSGFKSDAVTVYITI